MLLTGSGGLLTLAAAGVAAGETSAATTQGRNGNMEIKRNGSHPSRARSTENIMKIGLTVDGKAITATLIDSDTTRDFISVLPLTLMMNDLFKREKFGHLPRAISKEGKSTHAYAVGQLAYWPPRPDVAVLYRHDGERIPDPGIIIIGKLGFGMEVFDVPGSVRVTFELMK
jgi:hypothetical protein